MEIDHTDTHEITTSTRCPVDSCDEVFNTNHGARIHFRYHPDVEKQEALLAELRELNDDLGRPPTAGEMDAIGRFSVLTYQNYFSRGTEAVQSAGLIPHRRRDLTDAELISELHRFRDDLKRTPRASDMLEEGKYAVSSYVNRFRSWNRTLETAMYDPDLVYSADHVYLLNKLDRLHRELRRVPSKSHMTELGQFATRTYQSEFGSWNKAIRAAGMEPNWTFDESWNYHYGPNWSNRPEKTIERDGSACRICGCPREMATQDLNVHHIRPARGFVSGDDVDYTGMNELSNLITLCSGCHQRFEGLWTECSPVEFARCGREAGTR
jgi:5-methylcytosine-specific restriction endonuclease McrA